MAAVYILYSEEGDCYYTGSCKILENRFEDHISKIYKDSFTAKFNDWVLYLTIDNLEYEQARKIELHIKKMKSKKYIQNLKKFSEMQSKLIEKYKT